MLKMLIPFALFKIPLLCSLYFGVEEDPQASETLKVLNFASLGLL